MRQQEELEQTDTMIPPPYVFMCKISFVRGQILCGSLTNFQHYFCQWLSIWWQRGLPAVVNEQLQCFWPTGEICLGWPELNSWVLLLVVRRLLSCFIECCLRHFSSLTIWFSEGPPHDLNVQPMGCCSSVTLTPPSTSSASSVLWVAFMGHSPAGLISLQHTCVVLNCPCTYITCHVCPFVHSYHYRHHFIIKSCFSVTVKVHSQQSPHTEYVHVLLANIKFRSRSSHPASIR